MKKTNNININNPCLLCRTEAVSASSGKYCVRCYKDLLTNIFLNRYPITGKDFKKKLFKH